MKRKNFILLAAASTSAVAIPAWFYTVDHTAYDQAIAKPLLLSNIWNTKEIVDIGKLYIKKFPDENSEQKLVKLLSKSVSKKSDSATPSAMTRRVGDDYIDDKIIIIDGWILSVTEGRQCALFSLIDNQ